MPRPRSRSASRRSDTSEIDNDTIAETELSKLQRQYRIMEGDRNAYQTESKEKIRKQKSEIHLLEREHTELQKNLHLSESMSNKEKDDTNKETLLELRQQRDDLDRQIKEEQDNIQALEKDIRENERAIQKSHRDMGSASAKGHNATQTQKNIRVLENRLDQSLKKFNQLLTKNGEFRENIDHQRTERGRFEGNYKRLEKKHRDLKREIGETMEQSTQSYDQRYEAQAKMLLLKEKADKDLAQHLVEMKELQRLIDHDKKLKAFMTVKGQERTEDEMAVAMRKKREEVAALKKAREGPGGSIETYDEAFERIKEITGEEDLDLLVNKFIEVEDKNFALFNYINEQNNIIENLQDQIQVIKFEMDTFQKQEIELEEERKEILEDLETKQTISTRTADDYNEKYKGCYKILDQLRAGIDSLFNKINCDRSTIDEMLGSSAGVRDTNMMLYLGIIEQRTNTLLQTHSYLQYRDYEREYDTEEVPGLLGEGPQAAPQPLYIVAPSTGDDYVSDDSSNASDDETRPLTQAEIRSRIASRVIKKDKEFAKQQNFQYDLSPSSQKKKDKKSIKR